MEKLSIGCINRYFSLGGKSDSEVDDIVQVLQFKEIEGKVHGQIYTVTLSDSFQKFERFFLPKKLGGPIQVGDLVKIRAINKSVSKGKVFFKVLKYEVVGKSETIIGEPKSLENDINTEGNLNNNYTETKENNNHSAFENSYSNNKENIKSNTNSNNYVNKSGGDQNNGKYKQNNNNNDNKTPIVLEQSNPTKNNHMALNSLSSFTKELVILVRVIKKTDKKSFNSNYKDKNIGGCVFNFNILDSEGTEMQVNCFNKVAEKIYPIIKVGQVYEIIGGYIKLNDHKYNHTKSDYQIALNDDSIITPVFDDYSIAEIPLNLTKLDKLFDLKNFDYIDFIALVIQTNEKISINSKYGEMYIKKLIVADETGFKVDFTLWKNHADVEVNVGDIVLAKKAKIGAYSGRNLSASDDTQLVVNPKDKSLDDRLNSLKSLKSESSNKDNNHNLINDENEKTEKNIEEENRNDEEYTNTNTNTNKQVSSAISGNFDNFKTYLDLKYDEKNKKKEEMKLSTLSEAFNEDDKFHKVKVYLTQFKNSEKNIYAGCGKCMKKLIEIEDKFKCNGCNEDTEKPHYYLSFSIRVKDCTSDQWVDVFGNFAEKMLKITGEEYRAALNDNNEEVLNRICDNIEFKSFIMTVKCRFLVFNNIKKKKLNCYGLDKLDNKIEATRMLKNIENYN